MISEFANLHGMSPSAVSRYLSSYYPWRYKSENPELEDGLVGYIRPTTPDDRAFAHILEMRKLVIEKKAKNADLAAKMVLGFADQPLPPQIASEIKTILQEMDGRLSRIELMIENVDRYVKDVLKQRASRQQALKHSEQSEQEIAIEPESEMSLWQKETEQVISDISLLNIKGNNHEE